MRPDFLAACDPGQGAVVLGRWTPRARLGLHLRLGRLAEQADRAALAGEWDEYSRLLARYLHLCGVSVYRRPWLGPLNRLLGRFGRYTGAELRAAMAALVELNRLRWIMPFMAPSDGDPLPLSPADYDGRVWAWWVHKLAGRYGWSEAEIFDLWPEEAACYLQEIIVSEYGEREERRQLSETQYRYDKQAGKSVYHPLPQPGWMLPEKPEVIVKVRKSMLPMGNVVKL